jgi:hypothetical protein
VGNPIDDAVLAFWHDYKPQILISITITAVLITLLECAKPTTYILDPVAQDALDQMHGELSAVKSQVDDWSRIRNEDNAVRVEIENEIQDDLIQIHRHIDRKPQSVLVAMEEADVHVDGPIDNQYIVTMEYRGYQYQTIVTGKPDSPKNLDILLKWQEKKMEERDDAIQHSKKSP